MLHDLKYYVQTKQIMNLAIAADGTNNSSVVDIAGNDGSQLFVVSAPAYTAGNYELTVEEADDAGFTLGVNEIVATDDRWQGPKVGAVNPVISAVTNDGDNMVQIGVFSTKRYLRLKVVSTSTGAGATINAHIVQEKEVCDDV